MGEAVNDPPSGGLRLLKTNPGGRRACKTNFIAAKISLLFVRTLARCSCR
jgi:hypothetical protein